ncbi:MAG: hypothetical protein GY940_11335, partial [bacterium]|nr:hypothetical protein [bacterium]
PGKTNDRFYIEGYSYGKLTYPLARVKINKSEDEGNIYAYGVTPGGDTYPAILSKKVIAGTMLYVNLPLGHLKAHSDDLLLRSVLRNFLFKIAKLPHIVNTPGGKGGLILNWSIDSRNDWEGLSYMLENGFLSKDIKYSFHITAGDFNNNPGDELGFDAEGNGMKYLLPIVPYGTIGSHGGWGHGWFSRNVLSGKFGPKEIETYILKNNNALSNIAGYPMTEYSSPYGVHAQP